VAEPLFVTTTKLRAAKLEFVTDLLDLYDRAGDRFTLGIAHDNSRIRLPKPLNPIRRARQ